MEAQKATDKVSTRAENTANDIRDVVSGWNVTARYDEFSEKHQFVVYSDEDHVSTNAFAKGSVISTVMRAVPSLEVGSTKDGNMAVEFVYVNES